MLNMGYILHNMERMNEYNREEYLHDLAKQGMIHRSQINMIMNELHHRDEMRREENDISPFMESARKMLRQAEEDFQHPERKKPHQCPHCHGIGKRYVIKSTTIRQGNYRRDDGSYHLDDGSREISHNYEWETCPDCHGTGKVRD